MVGVDIFPLYYLSRNEEDASIQKIVLEMIMSMSTMEDAKSKAIEAGDYQLANEYNMQLAEGLVELQNVTSYQFTTDRPIKNQLIILFDQMCRLFGEEESDALTSFPQYLRFGYLVDKKLLEESMNMPFENIQINAPKEYDSILKINYRDYMTPRRVRAAHDYPFYKEQLEMLGKHVEQDDLKWKKSGISEENLIKDERTGFLIPQEWMEKIYPKQMEYKKRKIILYHTSADALLSHNEYVLEKLRYVMDVFSEQQDVLVWWMPCLLGKAHNSFVQAVSPQMVQDYLEVINEYRIENYGIYDESGDIERAIAFADAYYGDDGEIMQRFSDAGKCVMVQSYSVV